MQVHMPFFPLYCTFFRFGLAGNHPLSTLFFLLEEFEYRPEARERERTKPILRLDDNRMKKSYHQEHRSSDEDTCKIHFLTSILVTLPA